MSMFAITFICYDILQTVFASQKSPINKNKVRLSARDDILLLYFAKEMASLSSSDVFELFKPTCDVPGVCYISHIESHEESFKMLLSPYFDETVAKKSKTTTFSLIFVLSWFQLILENLNF